MISSLLCELSPQIMPCIGDLDFGDFLWRAFGTTHSGNGGFADVPADAYYAGAVAWAVANGVTNGVTTSRFAPNNSCTRAQIVTFLYRSCK